MADTLLDRLVKARSRDLRRTTGDMLRETRGARELSVRAVALAAHVDRGVLARAELGEAALTTDALAAVAAALGMEASIRFYQTVGPRVRDHVQTRMLGALLGRLDARWQPRVEVPVWGPARGVIDLVLVNAEQRTVVLCESHGELRSVEQQLRWAAEKADSVESAAGWPWSLDRPRRCRLLLLRNCVAMRDLVQAVPAVFAAAYPGRSDEAFGALVRGEGTVPDATVLWVDVDGTATRVLSRPPRGVSVGR